MRLLLIEDEDRLAAFIQRGLSEDSFVVDLAHAGEDALRMARAAPYDLVILDIMLPGIDGFAVCKELRAISVDVPILMLSARGMTEDRVKGLNLGADDYLTKPFDFGELRARLRALLRRRKPSEFLVLRVGDLTLELARRIVRQGERRVDLTNKEYALLEYLMRNAGEVVTRPMIAEHVWDFSWTGLTNVIDVYVTHLRRKIELPGKRLIHAVRGVGYVMREESSSD